MRTEDPIRNDVAGIYGNKGNNEKEYKIGDLGPANGLIFYDKGHFSNGWRYLEAAPVETELKGDRYRSDQLTGTALGTGKRNTELINGGAAQLCTSLDFDGYKDWFLPSKDELNLMYKNLKCKNLGDFSDDWYWSSSAAYGVPYVQSFGDGTIIDCNYYSLSIANVRAVRAF